MGPHLDNFDIDDSVELRLYKCSCGATYNEDTVGKVILVGHIHRFCPGCSRKVKRIPTKSVTKGTSNGS